MRKNSASNGNGVQVRLLRRNGSAHQCFLRIPTMTPEEAPLKFRDISTDADHFVTSEPRQRPSLNGAIRSLPGSNDPSFPHNRCIGPEHAGSSCQKKKTKAVNQPKRSDIVDDDLDNSTVPASGHRRTKLPGRASYRNAISRSADGNRTNYFQSDFTEMTPVGSFRNGIREISSIFKDLSRSRTDPERRLSSAGTRSEGFRVTSGTSGRECVMTKRQEAQPTRNSLVVRVPGTADPGLAGGRNGRLATTGVWDYTDSWISLKGRSERWLQKWGNNPGLNNSNSHISKITGNHRTKEALGELESNSQMKVSEGNQRTISDSSRETKTVCRDPKMPCHDDDVISRRSTSGSTSIGLSESDPVHLEVIDADPFLSPAQPFPSHRSGLSEAVDQKNTEGVATLDRNSSSSSVLPFASDEAWKVIEQLRLESVKQQAPQEERYLPTNPEHNKEHRESADHQPSERRQQEQVQGHAKEQTPPANNQSEEALLTLVTEYQIRQDQQDPPKTDQPDHKEPDAFHFNSTSDGKSFKATNVTKSANNLSRNSSSSRAERLRRILSESGMGLGRKLRPTETPSMANVAEKHPRPPVAPPSVNRKPGLLVKSKSSATLRTPPNRCCYDARGNGNEWPDGNYDWNLREEDGVVRRGSFRMTPFHYDSRYLDYLQRPSLAAGVSRDRMEPEFGCDETIAEAVIKCTAWLNGQDTQKADLTQTRCLKNLP